MYEFNNVVEKLHEYGTVYAVGGYVRDIVLNIKPQDIDLVVFNIKIDKFKEIMRSFNATFANNSFPVAIVKTNEWGNVEIALPRKEKSTGNGYVDFDIVCDPFISIEEDAQRRDFTFNAMYMNLVTHDIIDPFNGQNDLYLHRIVPVANFADDPLRIMRAVRFAIKYNLNFSGELMAAAIDMPKESFTPERLGIEYMKLAKIGKNVPYLRWEYVFTFLYMVGWLEYTFPWLVDVINMPFDANMYHREQLLQHICMVLEKSYTYMQDESPNVIFISALMHDSYKPRMQKWNDEKQRYQYIRHENIDDEAFTQFVNMNIPKTDVMRAKNICQKHMLWHNKLSKKTMFNMWLKYKELVFVMLDFALADELGRQADNYDTSHIEFMRKVYNKFKQQDKITGTDLIEQGYTPGPNIGNKLEQLWCEQFYNIYKEINNQYV